MKTSVHITMDKKNSRIAEEKKNGGSYKRKAARAKLYSEYVDYCFKKWGEKFEYFLGRAGLNELHNRARRRADIQNSRCYNLHIARCYNMYTALLPGLVRLWHRLPCFPPWHKMHDSNEEKQKQLISLRNINATITALFTQAVIVSKINITPIKHAVTTDTFARLFIT